MPVQLYGGVPLLVGGVPAIDPACCCTSGISGCFPTYTDDPPLVPSVFVTMSAWDPELVNGICFTGGSNCSSSYGAGTWELEAAGLLGGHYRYENFPRCNPGPTDNISLIADCNDPMFEGDYIWRVIFTIGYTPFSNQAVWELQWDGVSPVVHSGIHLLTLVTQIRNDHCQAPLTVTLNAPTP